MVQSLTPEQTELMNVGKLLPIMEDFYTLQGEGAHTGAASYFIRIGGCDVGCHWCDVKESWDASKHPLTPVDELVERATKYAKMIVITGGEPLMWNLEYLTQKLKEKGCKIHIETSGSHSLSGTLDWICLSPKKRLLPKQDVLDRASELKVIVFNHHDFKFAEEYAAKVSPDCVLYLQPEWSKREEMTPKIIDYILENPKWKISLQTHKVLRIP
ncbi:7-carboxy-7-deazaguanine synthase QueE [Ornithobacterium rhinotracheale]|uniref:7-carboxy-7-deazaguanine synthase QueE n=1 Tax=Ornithobacterium rhinotracheale TaxID=28251 RepID=UPI00129CF160|nr:7-carboxy-7-deazaguanine synthase QueE [Ornithobacterium rhinotracheale]MCK0205785.1 7-carboxy-7-deazaguanine synthase QueE [Ornithobacterium rhinotracheale]MRJ10720.1 7-carboxy-7-deazaguanine synthase QueE [Ornithobacterium rhinotracheale]